MAYHGYIKFICEYARYINDKKKEPVKILEIGVDTGVSLFAINNNLNLLKTPFHYTGIDILIQSHLVAIDYAFHQGSKDNKISLIEKNSLEYLKECREIFDIILIDGDHNYDTVKEELSSLKRIMNSDTLVICDDYSGRWSKKDLYYSEREEYLQNENATKKPDKVDKQGVGTAIDEYLNENPDFKHFKLIEGEPICLVKKDNNILNLGLL